MVDDLDLRSGDRVLDSACGPGLWAALLAEKVGPRGKVVGLDFSPELLAHARRSAAADSRGSVRELVLGDLEALPFRGGAFDAVFLGNCLCYLTEPLRVLRTHRQLVKAGGRLISKEFDGAGVVFHPVDPELTSRVLVASTRALGDPAAPPFDNFVGRKTYGLFRRAGCREVSTRSYAVQQVGPLSPVAQRYVRANAEWYGRRAAPYLAEADRRCWSEAFDPQAEGCILDREDLYFCIVETVTTGTT